MYWSQIHSRTPIESSSFLDGPSFSSRLVAEKRSSPKTSRPHPRTRTNEPLSIGPFTIRYLAGLLVAFSLILFGCVTAKDILTSMYPDASAFAENSYTAAANNTEKSPAVDEMQFPQSGMDEWSYLPYWGGTVAENGCGLCSYTSMVDILLDARYTPADMLSMRGDWAGMDGYVTDETGSGEIGSHSEWTLTTFGIYERRIDVDTESLARSLDSGSVVIALAGGERFKASSGYVADYPGHFVCIYAHDPDTNTFYVHDSSFSQDYGQAIPYSVDEMKHFLDGTSNLVAYSKATL